MQQNLSEWRPVPGFAVPTHYNNSKIILCFYISDYLLWWQCSKCDGVSPALSEEDLESVWAAVWKRKLKAVVSDAPYDGRGVHVFIRDLTGQHLPQHNTKWPADDIIHRWANQWVKDLSAVIILYAVHDIPDIHFLRHGFISNDLGCHPGHGAGERHLGALISEFFRRAKVWDLHQIIVCDQHALTHNYKTTIRQTQDTFCC